MNRRTFVTSSSLALLGSLLWDCTDTKKIPFKKNQVIACIGDSVTHAPNGYVQMLQDYADSQHPDLNLTFLNWGKSSETITGLTEKGHPGPRPYLFERLDALLNNTKVDVIFFCFGINCGIYGKPSPKLFESYKIGIYSFLEKIKQKGIQTILLTPPPLVLETVPLANPSSSKVYSWKNPYPNYNIEVLEPFTEIVLKMEHSTILDKIDIYSPLVKNQKTSYQKDPIHPNTNGHKVITEAIIQHLGF